MQLDAIRSKLEGAFTTIAEQQMAGLPLLNPIIKVEVVGLQPWQDGWCGVVITPWLMALMVGQGDGEPWDDMTLGDKVESSFPERSHQLTVNEFDGVGRCLTLSLESPMKAFPTHDSAVSRAESFISLLMLPPKEDAIPVDEVPADEARIQRFLSGEDMREIFEEEKAAMLAESGLTSREGSDACPASSESLVEKAREPMSRRDLLTGLRGEGTKAEQPTGEPG
uniref:Uncharacterized protein n=1 Tax=Magnetococcus massalia (strain MO-1) TaxID=451514 RepID=A0A1S7LCX3_MAGMO|nr:Conserved protein of unknown function [Candidatus Magnetococcus massalia]